jgi:uncharacterized protein
VSKLLSVYVIVPVVAWLAAQLVKTVIALSKHEHMGFYREFLGSGSMPSSHSAITVALLVVVGVRAGMDSAAFGVAFVLTAIVIYDALNVRRAVGEQGVVVKELAQKARLNEPFYMAKGHRPSEVVVGSLLGAAIAVIMLQIL